MAAATTMMVVAMIMSALGVTARLFDFLTVRAQSMFENGHVVFFANTIAKLERAEERAVRVRPRAVNPTLDLDKARTCSLIEQCTSAAFSCARNVNIVNRSILLHFSKCQLALIRDVSCQRSRCE